MSDEQNTDLVIPEIESSLAVDQASFDEMATASKFLARIQLVSTNSNLVIEQKVPKAGIYVFIVHGREIPEILGDDFDCAVIGWRPKAMHLLDNAPEGIYYDTKDPLFQECVDRSGEKAEDNGGHSFMYGPAFLVWAPKANNGNGGFAEFYCSSKTSRNSAPALRALIGRIATFGARFIAPKKSRFKWWGPEFKPCTTPLDNRPTQDQLTDELTKFMNPPKQEKELANDTNETGRET